MTKNSSLLLFLGGLVIIVSFFGVPSSWKTIAFSILGALIIVVALLIRRDITTGALCLHLTEEIETNSYKQNGALRSNSNHQQKVDQKKEVIQEDERKDETEEESKNEHEQDQNQKTTEPQT